MIKTISKTDIEKCIYRVRNAGDKKRSDDKYNEASVLVLFINDKVKKNSSILMIKRKDNLRKHAGQIAFPGGRKEKEDLNLEETARRETEEEINIYSDNTERKKINAHVVVIDFGVKKNILRCC